MENQKIDQPSNLKKFAVAICVIEAIIIILYGLFVRVNAVNVDGYTQTYYPMYQDVNVMMLVGFGFLMAYIKGYAWSGLSYTFFINAIVVQLYILLSGFWLRVFKGDWKHTKI